MRSPTSASSAGRAVDLDAPHAGPSAAWQSHQLLADPDMPPVRRAGHDRSCAGYRERAVDREPEGPVRVGLAEDAAAALEHCVADVLDSLPAQRGARDHRRPRERSADEAGGDLPADGFELRAFDHVHLGQRHDAASHAQHLEHVEVLASLRHDPLVGRHDEKRAVDARGAGNHRVDEALVAGDVDKGELDLAERVDQRRKTEDERHPPALLFGQAVAVHARERLHEGRLAVIDVAGRAEDDCAHPSILAGRR